MIEQIFPQKIQVPLEGLYLDQRLRAMAARLGRSLVLTDYVTDKNGVVAKADAKGHFQVPVEIKNSADWGRFQELMAQADVTISSGSYFKRLESSSAQDILYQFEPGNKYAELGQWRLDAGYERRSPDIAVITRHLDFGLPEKLVRSGRRIVIFTTDSLANSRKAQELRHANTLVLGSGETGVDGDRMISVLTNEFSYRVIMMVSGPNILDLLLKAKRLDLLYVTQVQVEIPFDDPKDVQTILPGGQRLSDLENFRLAHEFAQENVETESGTHVSQLFLRYDWID
jgi:hypothetical protein